MYKMNELLNSYLSYCSNQRRLDEKTIRAYNNDLNQFVNSLGRDVLIPKKDEIKNYIIDLHNKYKQKTVKRKIASVKAFYSYLENEEIIEISPMRKIRTEFREEIILPRVIPLEIIEKLLIHIYNEKNKKLTICQKKILQRDIVIIELLFATGLRISELCNLQKARFDVKKGILCIKGKGAKERYLQIGNKMVLTQVEEYLELWEEELEDKSYFLCNRYGNKYSEQSARIMINKYVNEASIDMHITPHMFRHAFATLLLEEDVDIRYIQKMLGHSSITTTQIYTEVASKKQMEILRNKHPRNKLII